MRKGVKVSKHGTLLWLDERGSALTRIWCLFEIWHTLQRGREWLTIITNADYSGALEIIADVDVAKAKASVKEDRDDILRDIANSKFTTAQIDKEITQALTNYMHNLKVRGS